MVYDECGSLYEPKRDPVCRLYRHIDQKGKHNPFHQQKARGIDGRWTVHESFQVPVRLYYTSLREVCIEVQTRDDAGRGVENGWREGARIRATSLRMFELEPRTP